MEGLIASIYRQQKRNGAALKQLRSEWYVGIGVHYTNALRE